MFLNRRRIFRVFAAAMLMALSLLSPGCGLRPDEGFGERRRKRAERLAEDPRTRPSYGELRQARALAMAEAEIIAKGGNIRVTTNGGAGSPDKVRYVHTPGALTLNITASERLNSLDGIPHALALTVYHLSDRAGLDMLSGTESGLRALMSGERFDESVLSTRTLFVQPGRSTTLVLDRAERGRYVAVVAGYHLADEHGALYVAEYGIGQYSTSGETLLHRPAPMFQPLPLILDVALGDERMSVFNNDGIYHFSQKAIHLGERQMHQALYKRNRVSGSYFESLVGTKGF